MDDLAGALELAPEHLSCYGLSLEEGAPLTRSVEDGSLVLPDEETCARMFLDGSKLLESQGYGHYEISNYARPGRESRHNRGIGPARTIWALARLRFPPSVAAGGRTLPPWTSMPRP